MLDKPDQSEVLTSNSSARQGEELDSAALARRRALFKGLGKGAAVVAATVPLQSMATGTKTVCGTQGNYVVCSCSGANSAAHSVAPSTPVACGQHPSKYCGSPPCTWPVTNTKKCNTVFTDCSIKKAGGSQMSLMEVLGSTSTSGSPNYGAAGDRNTLRSWIAAWLNSQKTANRYPYSAQEVVDLYGNPARRSSALYLFRTYLEQG
jgi:hypothetical protein